MIRPSAIHTFDTTEGNGLMQVTEPSETAALSRQLQGSIPVTFRGSDYNSGRIENQRTDFSSITVTATPTQRATGFNVSMHYEFPTEMQEAYWIAIARSFSGGGMRYDVYIDGVLLGQAVCNTASFLPDQDVVYEIPFTETEPAKANTIALRPVMYFPEAYAPYGNMPSVRDRAAAMDMPIGQRIPINGGCHDFYQGIAPGAALIKQHRVVFGERHSFRAMQFLRFASRIARTRGSIPTRS